MTISLLHAFTATVRTNLKSLQRQSKRLQKASAEVFGVPYPLTVCQEAVARSHGYANWSVLAKAASLIGIDRSLPAWHISDRNSLHQAVLSAIVTTELAERSDDLTVFYGDTSMSVLVALCWWLEEMSHRQLPGILLVDTDRDTLQDTEIGAAAEALGRTQLLQTFRSVDTRESRLPVALNAKSDDWCRSFASILADERQFDSTGARHVFEKAMEGFNAVEDRSYKGALDYYNVRNATHVLQNPKGWVPILLNNMDRAGVDKTSMEIDARECLGYVPYDERDDKESCGNRPDIDPIFFETAEELGCRSFNTGAVLYHESQFRPTIVLFSRHDPASVVLAGVIHSMYFWRYVVPRGNSKETIRPVMFFNDGEPGYYPSWLSSGTRTIIVDCAKQRPSKHEDNVFIHSAHIATSSLTGISSAGKHIAVRKDMSETSYQQEDQNV